ncbi:phosphatidate cytidylyltransferase [Demequina globuliformis]|uniref:phosphatidate cytidylyltransferase n=1 Tax=Demequina globuliformis TaxID=676202 RepID=UPI000783F8BA|nr:phosphatidate cytidylyltransferase [Demequina globuliformis]
MSIFRRRKSPHEEIPASSPTSFVPQHLTGTGLPSLHGADAGAEHAAGSTAAVATAPHVGTAAEVRQAQERARAEADVPDEGVDGDAIDPRIGPAVETPVPQVAPVARKGGRNMPVATAVGLTILIAALFIAWWSPLAFTIALTLVCMGAAYEWKTALATSSREVSIIPILLATAGMGVATWTGGPEGLVVALLVGCAGVVAWRVVDERVANTMADSMASILTLMWIPFLASFLILMETADHGWARVLILVIAVVGNDTGGLAAGIIAGKHPMAPRVSPKKTWEGFAGGIILGTVAAAVAAWFTLDQRWWIGACVGLACALAGVLGDLAESALKRDIQVKDMSGLIPGHGGIMDRLDSIVVAAPAGYVVFALFLGAS